METENLGLTAEDIDELLSSDGSGLLSPLSATIETSFLDELLGPLPIRLGGETNNSASPVNGNAANPQATANGSSSIEPQMPPDMLRVVPLQRRLTTKQRLHMLRSEASELTVQLEEARKKTREKSVPFLRSAHKVDEYQPMWESIAARQKKYLAESQSENVHLRKLIELQRRHVRNVERALRRQPEREEVAKAANTIATTNFQQMPESDTTFKYLLSKPDIQYARVDCIWKSLGISKLECPGRSCLTTKQAAREEVRIDYINRASMPFKMDSVEQMVWNYLSDARLRQPLVRTAKVINNCGSIVQVSLTMNGNHSGIEASSTTHSVSRKFVESNRVVFVSLSVTEPLVQNLVGIDGIKFFTTTVRMLKPGNNMSDGFQETIMESFRSTRGYDVDGVNKCPPGKIEPFFELGIDAMETAIVKEYEVIEDLLVRMSCKRIPTGK